MHKGIAVSPGVVVGVAYRVESVFGSSEPQTLADPGQVPAEIERFDRAVEESAAELESIVQKVAQELGPPRPRSSGRHLQIVNDQALLAKVHALIEQQQPDGASRPCRWSCRLRRPVRPDRARLFPRAAGRRPRRDLADRLAPDAADAGRSGGCHGDRHDGEEPVILVAHEILPSQAMSLGDLPIAGIVTETGGGTSHAAILSRSRGIPAVSGVVGITERGPLAATSWSSTAATGTSSSGPTARRPPAYRKMQREFFDLKDRLVLNRDQPAVSADGAQVELLANINNVADAQAADKVGRHRRRPVPHRVPVPHPPRRARRGGAVRVLPPDHRGLARTRP